jgi:hypothetical protein
MTKITVKNKLQKEFDAQVKAQKTKQLDKIVEKLQDATPKDTGYAESRWQHDGEKITNDADYIDDLNAGSSKQAPNHFIEKTVLSIPGVHPSGTIIRRN